MVGPFVLPKEKVKDVLQGLVDRGVVYAPEETRGGVQFVQLKDVPESAPGYGIEQNTILSVKGIFFPQTETLFRYDSIEKKDLKVPTLKDDIFVWGVRPCDARAMKLFDDVFSQRYTDPYYLERRKRTVLIGLGCNKAGYSCFCTSLGSSPFETKGLDVLLTDLGDSYFVDVLTEKGEKLIAGMEGKLDGSSDESVKKKDEIHSESLKSFRHDIDVDKVKDKIHNTFEGDIWKQIGERCIGCGICTYLCPTCYCFDIQDESFAGEGRRYRCWDACMFGEYSVHASGHNPRPSRRERQRNRYFHKFRYGPLNQGEVLCIGCGRCFTHCPVDINITETLGEISNMEVGE